MQSLYLFTNHQGLLVPFESKICKNCAVDCEDKLSAFDEDKMKSPNSTPEPRRSVLAHGDFQNDLDDPMLGSQSSTGTTGI